MPAPTPRTTSELVKGIIQTQEGVDLTPFIMAANLLTTQYCTYAPPSTVTPYSDGYIGSQMELIERWLSAHLYTIYDSQLTMARAGTVGVGYQYKIAYMLKNSMYGQQAMMLDMGGNLAKFDNQLSVARKIRVGGYWLGRRCGAPGDVDFGALWAELTVEQ